PLVPDQPRAEDAVRDQEQDRPPWADRPADLDDHVDLDERYDDEAGDQQPPQPRAAPSCGSGHQRLRHTARRTWSRRSRNPHRVMRRSDSVATAPLVLKPPRPRSTTSIAPSRTVSPARRQRVTRSVWKT